MVIYKTPMVSFVHCPLGDMQNEREKKGSFSHCWPAPSACQFPWHQNYRIWMFTVWLAISVAKSMWRDGGKMSFWIRLQETGDDHLVKFRYMAVDDQAPGGWICVFNQFGGRYKNWFKSTHRRLILVYKTKRNWSPSTQCVYQSKTYKTLKLK